MQCFLPCFWTLLFLSKLNCCKNIPVNNYSEHIDPAVFYSHSTLLVLSFIFDETCLFLYSLKYHIPRTLLKEDLVKAYHFSFFVFVTYHILLQPSQKYFSRTSTNTKFCNPSPVTPRQKLLKTTFSTIFCNIIIIFLICLDFLTPGFLRYLGFFCYLFINLHFLNKTHARNCLCFYVWD